MFKANKGKNRTLKVYQIEKYLSSVFDDLLGHGTNPSNHNKTLSIGLQQRERNELVVLCLLSDKFLNFNMWRKLLWSDVRAICLENVLDFRFISSIKRFFPNRPCSETAYTILNRSRRENMKLESFDRSRADFMFGNVNFKYLNSPSFHNILQSVAQYAPAYVVFLTDISGRFNTDDNTP